MPLRAVVRDPADLCTAFPGLSCGQAAGLLAAADQGAVPQFTVVRDVHHVHLTCQVSRQRNGTYHVTDVARLKTRHADRSPGPEGRQ